MHLSELPVEILARVLHFEDYLSRLPREIIIPWLNLLPQAKLYRIIGESGFGGIVTKEKWPYCISLSGKVCNNYGQSFETVKAHVSKINKTFMNKVFVKSGAMQNVQPKHRKKYVIFDIEAVGHLIQKYLQMLFNVRLWTGDDRLYVYLWCPYMHRYTYRPSKYISLMHPSKFNYGYELMNLTRAWFTGNQKLLKKARNFTQCHFECIDSLQLSMSMRELKDMRTHYSFLSKSLQPKELKMYLNLVNTDFPSDFPIRWITEVFNVSKVQIFSLHYFDPNTTINEIDLLFEEMPNILELDLSFGKLNLKEVARLLPYKDSECHIQAKVDRHFFETYQFKHIKSVWKFDVKDTYVVTGYIKKAFVSDLSIKRLSLGQCLRTWFRHRWEINQEKLEAFLDC